MPPDNFHRSEVVVTGVTIPFFDLMWLLVKLALASIPAAIIIAIIYGLVVLFGAGFFMALSGA